MSDQIIDYIYDDSAFVSPQIENIVGKRRYGSIHYRRKSLVDHAKKTALAISSSVRFHHIQTLKNLEELSSKLSGSEALVFYHPATVVPINEEISIQLKKAVLAKCDLVYAIGSHFKFSFFYKSRNLLDSILNAKESSATKIDLSDYCLDISDYQTCLNFFSGAFDTRYFNQVIGDKNFVVKSSRDTEKMQAEHDYYYNLPPSMQYWFVQPFNFKNEGNKASYQMERLLVADCALQWIHGAFTLEEFDRLLQKIFLFLSTRAENRNICLDELNALSDDLYLKKVMNRFEQLKAATSLYSKLDHFVKTSTSFKNLAEVYERYAVLYRGLERNRKHSSVLGHGDLCFSNILYDKNTQMMRLIDPKGCKGESLAWTDPFYDVAKISHSILGNYDWINNDLFELRIEEDLNISLHVDCQNHDSAVMKTLFRSYLDKYKFDYNRVRLLEVSLFLSMLPLHIDSEKKVLGFLFNAIKILTEIEERGTK